MSKKNNDRRVPFYLYLITSARNIVTYLLLYLMVKGSFIPEIFKANLPEKYEYFMRIYGAIFLVFFIVGMIASNSIKNILGYFNHTIYLKYEIIIALVFGALLELFYF